MILYSSTTSIACKRALAREENFCIFGPETLLVGFIFPLSGLVGAPDLWSVVSRFFGPKKRVFQEQIKTFCTLPLRFRGGVELEAHTNL